MNRHNALVLKALVLFSFVALNANGQHIADVHGTGTYVVGENDDVTLKDAKIRCIALAHADAIKQVFGELVASDVITTNVGLEGKDSKSYFWENTTLMAKGEWLEDTQAPVVSVAYEENRLTFKAEVWGKAREIVQSQVELEWALKSGTPENKVPTTVFNHGDRLFLDFKAPADGYIVIYLIMENDEAARLLPYRNDTGGRYEVRGGKTYTFFDRTTNPDADQLRLTTQKELESYQVVLVYSPHPFIKCPDVSGDRNHPNSLSTHDFQKWQAKQKRQDSEMVIATQWVKVKGKKAVY